MRTGYKVILRVPKKFPDYGKGKCKFCGDPVLPPRRAYCCDTHHRCYLLDTAKHTILDWNTLRYEILKRDNDICQECGYNGIVINFEDPRILEVHHIIPIHNGGDEWDPDNCITLCDKCHKKKHKKRWREPKKGQKKLEI